MTGVTHGRAERTAQLARADAEDAERTRSEADALRTRAADLMVASATRAAARARLHAAELAKREAAILGECTAELSAALAAFDGSYPAAARVGDATLRWEAAAQRDLEASITLQLWILAGSQRLQRDPEALAGLVTALQDSGGSAPLVHAERALRAFANGNPSAAVRAVEAIFESVDRAAMSMRGCDHEAFAPTWAAYAGAITGASRAAALEAVKRAEHAAGVAAAEATQARISRARAGDLRSGEGMPVGWLEHVRSWIDKVAGFETPVRPMQEPPNDPR